MLFIHSITKKSLLFDPLYLLGTITFAFLFFICVTLLNNIKKINAEHRNYKNQVKIMLHDLKSPISSYLGLADIISYLLKNQQYDKIDVVSREIDAYSGELEKLYLDLNKSIHNEHDTETILELFAIGPLLEKGLLIYSRLANLAGITIVNEVNFQKMIYTNDYLFLTIFRNVLDNAVKNSKPGSSIIVTAMDKETNVRIAVTNDSSNLNKTKIKKVNDFLKSKGSTPSLPGSRIGMHVIKNYSKVLEIRLNISYDSEKVTFELYVPKEPPQMSQNQILIISSKKYPYIFFLKNIRMIMGVVKNQLCPKKRKVL